MPNMMTDFKKYFRFLSPEYQICKINFMINEFNKSNSKVEKINKKFCILNELKILKKEIMFNHEEHLHYE